MDAPALASAMRDDKPRIDRDGVLIEVITGGVDGHVSPLSTTQPTRVLHVTSQRGGRFALDDDKERPRHVQTSGVLSKEFTHAPAS